MLDILVLQFLFAIQGVESNHGKDLHHRTIAAIQSIHYGDAAISSWGMMPQTIISLKKDVNRFKTEPKYERQVARLYALKVLQAAHGCPLTASVLWLRGPGAKPIKADFNTPRFKRFVKEWASFGSDQFIGRYCQ